MKKILVVCQHFWPENFRINDICMGFAENDCEVEVLCGIPNYPQGEIYDGYGYFKNKRQNFHGIKVRRCWEIKRGSNRNIRIFLNYISFPFFSLFHLPYLLTQEYDRVFLYQLSPVMMSIAGIWLGRIKKIPTVMYVLDLWPENLFSVLDIQNKFLRNVAKKISHWHYKKTDKLIAISNKMKDILTDITHKDDIMVLPQFCEKIYEREIHDPQLSKRFSHGFNLVFTGNISPAQSFETVLEAAVYLREQGIYDINWIIVGSGMSKKQLAEDVERLQLSGCFYFEGHHPIDDIPKYTGIADALFGCLAKKDMLDCTIPAKVMSYIAAGKPIVLAMDGEAQDMINENRLGFAGDAGDSRQFAEHIKRLYKMDRAQRAQMGANAKRLHNAMFERNLNIKRLLDYMFD